MKRLYRLQADFFRIIAHPKRLEILDLLRDGEINVSQLASAMGVRSVNVSQELAPLRNAGIVQTRRDGKAVYYRVSSPKIVRAYDLLIEAWRELTAARARVAESRESAERR